MAKMGDSGIRKTILDYLMDQNRPFSANDITNAVLQDLGKTAKTRALDHLVSESKVNEKSYGKQKVYFINQDVFGDAKNSDLQSMDSQINELSNTLDTLHKQIKTSESTLENLNKSLPTERALSELENTKKEISEIENKLKKIESKCVVVDANAKKKLSEDREKCLKLYKRRKRMANNVVDAILEGYPKSKKQLLEDIGLEVDDVKL